MCSMNSENESNIKKLQKLGMNIIPIRPYSKIPYLSTWRKYQIEPFTGPFPKDCNYAMICGKVSGFVVLDTDSPEAEEYAQQNFPKTGIMSKTRKGFHRYYKHPGYFVHSTNTVCPSGKLDLKGDGGYVLIPPSNFDTGEGQYQWVTLDPENVPVFDRKWGGGKEKIEDQNKRQSDVLKNIITAINDSEMVKTMKQSLIAKNCIKEVVKPGLYTIYVKNVCTVLDDLHIPYDTEKAGPRKSTTPHVNGYLTINHTGFKFQSFSGGVFCQIHFSLETQLSILNKAHGLA